MKPMTYLRVVLPLLILSVTPAFGQSYQWKNVTIKGGGFVTGIITHPNAPGVMYARTDIGGAYRFAPASNSWVPLLDFAADANPYGVESVAIDPSDSNRVYIAASRGSSTLRFILVSTNQGATFASYTAPFSLDGNYDGRSCGERMAVDPNSGNVLFYGTRASQLYKSVNYGASWTPVTFPVTSTANNIGLVFVEFIQGSGTPGSPTPVIFVGVSQTGTNLYRSTNGGANWSPVSTGAGTNFLAHHAAQDGLGNMFVTANNNQGPNNITDGKVLKLNLATLAVTDVTPVKIPGEQGGFAGVSVDRQNPSRVAVSTMDRWWAPAPYAPWDQIYRSVNGGTNWVETMPATLPDATSAPWSTARNPHWAGDVEIDPFNSNRVFFITGYGIIGTANFTAASPNWAFMSDGIEETVPLGLASPPSGPFLLSGHGDIGGFRHYNLDVSPPQADYFSTYRVTSLGIDFAETNPNRIVRLFSGSPHGACSTNGGTTWLGFGTPPAGVSGDNRGNVAMSADGGRIVWMPAGSSMVAHYSGNSGATWTACVGGPTGTRIPISDRVNSNKFYIYSSGSGGRIYVSTNGGANFGQGAAISSGVNPRAVFGREGHIWLPRGGSGLSRSINSGTNFTTVTSVQQATYVSFGLAAAGQSYPAVYIIGQVTNVTGIFRSIDEGATWTRINDDQHQFGLSWIHAFCADPRVFGRVYFGTEGRGVIYGEPATVPLPEPPADLVAVPGQGQVSLGWTASPGATNYYVKQSTAGGGPYTVIATNSSAAFIDAGLNNGTLYYYVVSALGGGGESGDSAEANARPFSLAPIEISLAQANNQVQLSWPPDHTGWQVQVQTNSPGEGLGTQWTTAPDSGLTNLFSLPVDPANGSVFLRLISP